LNPTYRWAKTKNHDKISNTKFSHNKFDKIANMKSLNLAQPVVMIVVGLPGSGKSFFAKKFSGTFGAPVVSVDRIRYELFGQSSFSSDEQDLVERLTNYQIEELLKSSRSFIIDGGFEPKVARQKLGTLAKKAGYDVLIIWVQTHETIAQKRSLKRNPKKEDDKHNNSLTSEQFKTLSKRFTPPATEHNVVISGMHTYSTQAKAVLRKLVAKREAQAEAAHKSELQTVQHQPRPESPRRSVIIR
jgi:predicted kinase